MYERFYIAPIFRDRKKLLYLSRSSYFQQMNGLPSLPLFGEAKVETNKFFWISAIEVAEPMPQINMTMECLTKEETEEALKEMENAGIV